jgi:hypothetical protein
MLVIRRMDDGKHSYTAIFLPGEPAHIFPTNDHEHARILQIFKQDRPYRDVLNDFTDYRIGADAPAAPPGIIPLSGTSVRR